MKMNYIRRLQRATRQQGAVAREVEDDITGFMAHLQSPKFHQDTTIQVNDVFKFLQDLRMKVGGVAHELENP